MFNFEKSDFWKLNVCHHFGIFIEKSYKRLPSNGERLPYTVLLHQRKIGDEKEIEPKKTKRR